MQHDCGSFMRSLPAVSTMKKSLLVLLLGTVGLAGCGVTAGGSPPAAFTTEAVSPTPTIIDSIIGATATPTVWIPPTALVGTPRPGAEATLTAAPTLRTARITLVNSTGDKVDMTVEVADTEANRELGLMFRPRLDPDAGMLFDFNGDTTSGFWMQNTILPLSIAFIKADGAIISVQDMQPLDLTGVGAPAPYRYALETNQGYFRAHNIEEGDKVILPDSREAVLPGMPACNK